MTDEKILAFLQLRKDSGINKSLAKTLIWFDVGVTIAVLIINLLLCKMGMTVFNIICISILVITDIVFAIWYLNFKIPTQIYKYASVVMSITMLKLFYGSIVFSVKYQEKITFLHIIVFIVCVVLSFINIIRRRKYLKDLETMSIKETEKKWAKKDKGIGVFVLPISTTAVLAITLSRVFSNTLSDKIGLGFILWTLACLWSIMIVLFIQNWMLVNKYKIADIFKQ
ncbi:MAG: hypothetical protein IJD45_05740 [Clostridia bacterium]|nr:hypothetical protein [Clostridia bacterium]